MNLYEAIAYGVIQGITEFLPISSSGHLVLLPWFLGWEDPGLNFNVALHWGTLLGVVCYYKKDIADMVRGFGGSLKGGRKSENILPWQILVVTIPGALMGYFGEHLADTVFRSPWIIANQLILVGVLLFLADQKTQGVKSISELTWTALLLLGVAQGIAIIPGTSRSGITIMAGLFLGLNRESAVRFSFLMAIPIIFGAGIMKLNYLQSNITNLVFLVGVVSSAVSGYAAIYFLVHYVKKYSLTPFVIYRFVLAAVVMGLILTR